MDWVLKEFGKNEPDSEPNMFEYLANQPEKEALHYAMFKVMVGLEPRVDLMVTLTSGVRCINRVKYIPAIRCWHFTAMTPPPELLGLTGRQIEILQMLADGLDATDIAQRYDITRSAVHYQLSEIRSRAGRDTTASAVAWAVANGLVTA
jgi:DNA-binding NarL/FixJ family response regulator